MPRYFFDTTNGETAYVDTDGLDLADDEEARTHALDALPDMASDDMPNGDDRRLVVTVRGEDGAVVYTASLTLRGRWNHHKRG
jgi:hypothetical protein